MSIRNVQADDVLDAAYASVLAVGVRRTTMSEIARRTGVSRMTVYRHFPDVTSVIAELMTREFCALLERIEQDVTSLPTARARLVEACVLTTRRLPEHPLLERVLDVDPELLIPYVFDRLGGTQEAAISALVRLLEGGRQDGSVRCYDDASRLAYCLQLTVQAFVLSARITAERSSPRAIEDELRKMLDAYLVADDMPGVVAA